ncbi:MAG: DUF4468 domain-containing protein [Hymenobacter sp.]|nr:MAG: DUF4468 domain-containing protein [Hymenobacter sp.]
MPGATRCRPTFSPSIAMKFVCLCGALALPLVGAAQQMAATHPPITYHVGLTKAPLYRSAADTARKPSRYLFSQAEALVVAQFSPRWVVVNNDGFLYLTPVDKLPDYDPADAEKLPLDPRTQLITYEGVVPVPGVSQADLYARATAWVAKAYPSNNAVLEQQDAATGQLVVQGELPAVAYTMYGGVLRSSYAGVVRHTLTIYVKDGRYKYILSNLTHDAKGTPTMKSGGALEQNHASLFGYAGIGSHKPWVDLKVAATRDVRHQLAGLEEAMTLQKPRAAKKANDF